MRAASSPAAKRVQTKRVAAVIAAAMNFMMNSHHPHAWTTPVDVRTAGCAMAMFRRQTAAANSTIRKGSAVCPTRWRGASMPAVGLGRVGWPPVGFGARQQARRGPQEDLYRSCAENSLEKCTMVSLCRVSLTPNAPTALLRVGSGGLFFGLVGAPAPKRAPERKRGWWVCSSRWKATVTISTRRRS